MLFIGQWALILQTPSCGQMINGAGSKFSKDVIPITVQGKTINVNAKVEFGNKGFKVDSYQPQGEMIVEKKQKSTGIL